MRPLSAHVIPLNDVPLAEAAAAFLVRRDPDADTLRSCGRAEYLFKQDTKKHDRRKRGFTLHQLRHSRLTHLAEDGWSAPMLMGLSGHANIRSLAIYGNISAEAVAGALARNDLGRRHR